ncbi:MAG: fluoride efflux transporter CrcB [Negativicutes bacterium]|nr:fluoride efflux transporter CrcB [Negativicutes bacterium]
MVNLLLVAAGGGTGAVCRYLTSLYAASRWGAAFPYGTLIVNIAGSFIIGLFLTLAVERFDLDPRWRLLIATGFLGGLTTFSSFSIETLSLWEAGALSYALLNTAGNLLLSLLACWAGMVAARVV